MIEFTLNIPPQSKQRIRAGIRGNMYTSKKTRDFQKKVWQLTQHMTPIDGFVSIDATFVFKRPMNMSKKITGRQPRGGVPDLDNLEKALYDSLQGTVLVNDSKIVESTARKVYGDIGEEAKIIVRINTYK